MTLVLAGVKESDVTAKLSGTTMTVAKKSAPSQKITVQGWSAETHSIVYCGALSAFDAYAKAASPTAAQTTAAQNEVFKAANLATA